MELLTGREDQVDDAKGIIVQRGVVISCEDLENEARKRNAIGKDLTPTGVTSYMLSASMDSCCYLMIASRMFGIECAKSIIDFTYPIYLALKRQKLQKRISFMPKSNDVVILPLPVFSVETEDLVKEIMEDPMLIVNKVVLAYASHLFAVDLFGKVFGREAMESKSKSISDECMGAADIVSEDFMKRAMMIDNIKEKVGESVNESSRRTLISAVSSFASEECSCSAIAGPIIPDVIKWIEGMQNFDSFLKTLRERHGNRCTCAHCFTVTIIGEYDMEHKTGTFISMGSTHGLFGGESKPAYC